jgi:exo-beta-1,3-glucanase (GH17 family)
VRNKLLLYSLIFASAEPLAAQPSPHVISRILARTHWVSYAPTHYYPGETPPVYPDIESITVDLSILRGAGFDGLITYSAELGSIPSLAEKVGFRSMLIGIWDPWSPKERLELLKAVREHRELIAGVIVGNEGLLSGRYSIGSLCEAMADLRRATSKPVSSTEPVDWVLGERRLAECSTFLSVNAHPYFSNHREAQDAVRWTVVTWDAIRRRYPQLPLLFKEVGLPSAGGSDLSEESQKAYYQRLSQTKLVFSYFEAFDATARFKRGLVEQSWGLWRADRTPKPVVDALPWRSRK